MSEHDDEQVHWAYEQGFKEGHQCFHCKGDGGGLALLCKSCAEEILPIKISEERAVLEAAERAFQLSLPDQMTDAWWDAIEALDEAVARMLKARGEKT